MHPHNIIIIFFPTQCELHVTTHGELLAVLHELCQVEDDLGDLRDVLQSQCLLETSDQVLLVDGTKLHPARHKRSIEQFPVRQYQK